ncbi:MAG TPA: DUF5666 domain-containing protein [Candidatus Solibacter sp.]|nr:DUF5666 domain-containing protein [Candidatus Solibacter sp.]
MKRSPLSIILAAFLLTAVVYPQSNSPAPKQAGAPDAPTTGTQNTGVQSTPLAKPAPSGSEATGSAQSPAPATTTEEPQQPKTVILDSSATSGGVLVTDGTDPILDPPPLPDGKTTLVGGVVSNVDHIRNHMTIAVFGGGRWKVGFDERTHIFRNGAETTQLAIKKGERVYVDTMLDKSRHQVFARNIRVGAAALPADADGQVVDVDPEHQTLVLRDQIGASPVHFSVNGDTKITHGTSAASFNDVRPGSLVHVKFSPERPNRGLAREIAIVAAPGSAFTFVGKITYLDVHRGLLALQSVLDDKNYEVHFNPAHIDVKDSLAVGTEVRIVATFDGPKYTAQTIVLTKPAE